jgi:predicted enzyme related to lactoylglutathione lyase
MAEQTNIWCHVEIPAGDTERCKKFYADLFGWRFEDVPGMDYSFYTTREGGIGGGVTSKSEQGPPHMVNYVYVDNIADTLAVAESSGGTVAVPQTEVQGMGWFALIKDPEDNLFGIWKSANEG